MIDIRILNIVPEASGSNYCSPKVTIEISNQSDTDVVFDHFDTKYYLEINTNECSIIIDHALRLEMLFSRVSKGMPEQQVLAAKATMQVEMDLAEFYYPLAEGSYTFCACCRVEKGIIFKSEIIHYSVFQTKVVDDVLWYENPIFGNLSLLSKSIDEKGTEEYFLRWYNPDRPLASNFTNKIEGVPNNSQVIVSKPAFFTLDDFDPSFEKVLICFDKIKTLQVIKLFIGETTEISPKIEFNDEVKLLPFSFRDPQNNVRIFLIEGDRKISCCRISPDYTLNLEFSHTFTYSLVKYGQKINISITGGPDVIHMTTFGRGLIHSLFDYNGKVVSETTLFNCQDVPVYLDVDLYKNNIKAIYYSGENRYTFLSCNYPDVNGMFDKNIKKYRLIFGRNEMLEEIDFLILRNNKLCLAYSTSGGRLVYGDEYVGFKRLIRNKQVRYPRLVPGDIEMFRPFIGISIPETGYRFYSLEGSNPWKNIKLKRI